MARPITWQDVAAPRGQAVAIEALLRSGQQAGQGLERIGQTFMDANIAQKEAATGAAVAAIANSDDPFAQAAATPQGWQFDPLAIATASNAREGQLFDRTVKESDLRENELNIKNTQSILDDRESMRTVATLIAPYEALARANKDFDVDEDSNPAWKTPAGLEAKKHLEGLRKEARQFQLDSERLGIERARAARESRAAKRAENADERILNQQNAANRVAAWRFSPEGSKATPGEVLTYSMGVAKEEGVGESFGTQLAQKYGSDEFRGTATREQLEALSPQGMSYETPIAALKVKNSQHEEEFNKREQQRKAANAAVTALSNNDYSETSPAKINVELINRNPQNISFWQGTKDMQQRRDRQVALAKDDVYAVAKELGVEVPKGFRALEPEQEAQLVELTLQKWAWSDRYSSDNPAAEALRRDFIRYNLLGGKKNFDKRAADDAAATQAAIEKNLELARQTESAGRLGEKIPEPAFKFVEEQYRVR